MKYIITLWIGLCFATSASAQDNVLPYAKGTKMVGFGMNSSATVLELTGLTETISTGTLNAQFGYFVTNGLVIGFDMNSASTLVELEGMMGTTKIEMTEGTLGFFTAYYFRFGENHAIYPELRVFGGSAEQKGGGNPYEYEIGGSSIGLGYTYRMNRHLGLDVKLRAGTQTEKNVNSGNENELGLGQFLFGFQIFL